MIGILESLIHLALNIYKLMLVAVFVIGLIKLSANQWTELLASVTEPLLAPVRKLLHQYLPRKWHVVDWSPIALIILISIVQWLL